MMPLCRDQGIAVIPWSLLGCGLLTRRPTDNGSSKTARSQTDAFGKTLYTRDDDRQTAQVVSEMAEARRLPMAQVAPAWVLRLRRRHGRA